MALTRSKKEERLGSSKYMNCGSLATIIKYQNSRKSNLATMEQRRNFKSFY